MGYQSVHGTPMIDLGVLHLYLVTPDAMKSLQAAVVAAKGEGMATARPQFSVVDTAMAERLQRSRGASMLISLHVYGPAFRCGSDEHGRPRIHIGGYRGGGEVTLAVDEP